MTDDYKGPERRDQEWLRPLMERAAELGGEKAIDNFIREFSPHDPTQHEGRMQLRSDMYFNHKRRQFSEALRVHAWRTAMGALILAGIGWLIAQADHLNPFINHSGN